MATQKEQSPEVDYLIKKKFNAMQLCNVQAFARSIGVLDDHSNCRKKKITKLVIDSDKCGTFEDFNAAMKDFNRKQREKEDEEYTDTGDEEDTESEKNTDKEHEQDAVGEEEDDKEAEKCMICLQKLDHHVATLSGCTHHFHRDCILGWKNFANQCPLCKRRFIQIQEGANTYAVSPRNQKNGDTLQEAYLNTLEPCCICDLDENPRYALLCDGCDKCFHTYCIGLDLVPENAWYCETCLSLMQPKEDSPELHDYDSDYNPEPEQMKRKRKRKRKKENETEQVAWKKRRKMNNNHNHNQKRKKRKERKNRKRASKKGLSGSLITTQDASMKRYNTNIRQSKKDQIQGLNRWMAMESKNRKRASKNNTNKKTKNNNKREMDDSSEQEMHYEDDKFLKDRPFILAMDCTQLKRKKEKKRKRKRKRKKEKETEQVDQEMHYEDDTFFKDQ